MKRELSVSTIREGKLLKILPAGWIDTLTAEEFENTILENLEGMEELVIDFGDVEDISSSGLRVLMKLHKLMQGRKGLKILNARANVAEVFEAAGFIGNLDIE